MRVVAGKYGSRPLQAVKGDKTRPTSDKVKGAVFSTLGGFFEGGRMLDCYAGTGSMALEALSRGMDHADLVDESPLAIKTIKENIRSVINDDRHPDYCLDALNCDTYKMIETK